MTPRSFVRSVSTQSNSSTDRARRTIASVVICTVFPRGRGVFRRSCLRLPLYTDITHVILDFSGL